jgi:hypothetical protein
VAFEYPVVGTKIKRPGALSTVPAAQDGHSEAGKRARLMAMPLTCSPARIRASKRWRVIVDTDGLLIAL